MTHPSTSYLLFNNLGPLVNDESKLAFVKHRDVEYLIGNEPFRQSEKDLIAEHDSTVTRPLLVFLGLDERQKEGMSYKTYSGAPYFALDVSPTGTIREPAQRIVSAMEARSLRFFQGRSHMKFSPEEGNTNNFLRTNFLPTNITFSCALFNGKSRHRLEFTKPILFSVWWFDSFSPSRF